ncbi:hypothetical protein [Larkinella soli]|uniref:hypothetical protein n=1 Tax=Larkinella soli TaxID=1770527 RepID=UPI000FFCB0F9|nr:hypothetical protein [Larkinella soli]
MKIARTTISGPYTCLKDWQDDCFVQAGDDGLVFSSKGNYLTAFFEAFPNNPDTFIRGEGKTIEEAEESAWGQLQRFQACSGHDFERRNYRNGAGFCKHCGMFKSKAFEPLDRCHICGVPTQHCYDTKRNWFCEQHKDQRPEEEVPEFEKRLNELLEITARRTGKNP